jgi:uncharacterized membrane protein
MTIQTKDQTSNVNVSLGERYLSIMSGLTLIWRGIKRRDLRGVWMMMTGGYMLMRGINGHCMLYQALKINRAVETNPQAVSVPHQQGTHIESSVTVHRPVEEVYSFWRNFENLPRIMSHLEAVQVIDNKRSHWVVKAPVGAQVEWDAEIVNEVPNEVIGWRSLGNAEIANAGSVRFIPKEDGQSTQIKVSLEYVPPAGKVGEIIAMLLGEEPRVQLRDDLRNFKKAMESGELLAV